MRLAIEINDICKEYNGRLVLDHVTTNVPQGEIVGLIGLNGIGKTTLIKTILDLIKPSHGNISIFGQDSTKTKSRAGLFYLPEKFHPSAYLKGYEFLEFSLGYFNQALDRLAADRMAIELELNPKALSQRITRYSKGMTQKLGLMATFLSDAALSILDEPMSGLDPLARIKLKDQLIKHRAKGKTIFFSSHILADIDEICDRIIIIHNGKIIFEGTPSAFRVSHDNLPLERAFLAEIS